MFYLARLNAKGHSEVEQDKASNIETDREGSERIFLQKDIGFVPC